MSRGIGDADVPSPSRIRHARSADCVKRVVSVFALSVMCGAAGIASAAFAADLPQPPTTYLPLAPRYNWTGFYIGGNIGLGWSFGSFSDSLGNTLSLPNSTQFMAGGQIGFNYEFESGFLIGAEGDFDWLANAANVGSAATLVNAAGPTGSTAVVSLNSRSLTTATARLGYAWDRVLLYGKGGGAWLGSNNPTVTVDGAAVGISNSSTNWGWVAGVGAEWAFAGNWSARVEFEYVGLNNQTFTIPASAAASRPAISSAAITAASNL